MFKWILLDYDDRFAMLRPAAMVRPAAIVRRPTVYTYQYCQAEAFSHRRDHHRMRFNGFLTYYTILVLHTTLVSSLRRFDLKGAECRLLYNIMCNCCYSI